MALSYVVFGGVPSAACLAPGGIVSAPEVVVSGVVSMGASPPGAGVLPPPVGRGRTGLVTVDVKGTHVSFTYDDKYPSGV